VILFPPFRKTNTPREAGGKEIAPVTETTMAWSPYGTVKVTGIAAKGNVCGSQFHPEKSGAVGLNMLRAFARM
jgi:imidazoleglycerol phosphate synthase glutamine amidotransferase subunit HisH